MQIYVGNLTHTTTDQELRQLFEVYGTVQRVHLPQDRETGRLPGLGFVDMPNATEANAAIVGLNGTALGGRMLTVKSNPFSFYDDEHTQAVFFRHWQALRRREAYKRDAQECLRNLQALYDQWITDRQTLGPRPTLSPNASAITTEIDGLVRINRSMRYAALPSSLEEKRWMLLDLLPNETAGGRLPTLPAETRLAVARELLEYWEWEDVDGRLKRDITEYQTLMDTLECATNFFRSWDPSLESLPGQPSQLSEPDKFTLGKFTLLCSKVSRESAFLQKFKPLATLQYHHGILLPLDHRIPQLPLLAASAVFPNISPVDATRIYRRIEPRVITTLTFTSQTSRAAVHKAVKALLPPATSRIESLGHYVKAFKVYDRKQIGALTDDKASWPAIGREEFPEDFEQLERPFKRDNHKYRRFVQHIKDLYDLAEELINNT